MKTAQEINDLLEQVRLEGHLRRTPTDFVLLEVLLNLNARLLALEDLMGRRLAALDLKVKALRFFTLAHMRPRQRPRLSASAHTLLRATAGAPTIARPRAPLRARARLTRTSAHARAEP